jgi:hypothetical protein
MILAISIIIIFIISLVMAIRSVEHELSVPKEVKNIKIRKNEGLSGVILFLKKKIIHYSSSS